MTDHIRPLVCDEARNMPSLEALIAGTLALMTGYAQSQDGTGHKELIAGKLLLHLQTLSEHAGLSAPLRQTLAGLQRRWQMQLSAAAPDTPTAWSATPLWHAAPGQIQ